MKKVIIYTDGACSGNPGAGGWAAILIYGTAKKEISGGTVNTTNNRMELTAAIEALKMLKEPCMVDLHSDNAYMVNAFNNDWIASWKKRAIDFDGKKIWINSSQKAVENQDLWKELCALVDKNNVKFVHVNGHSNNEYNEMCDTLAVYQRDLFKKQAENEKLVK